MFKAQFGGCVTEGTVLGILCVAVPAAGGQAGRVVSQEARSIPRVDFLSQARREIRPSIDYPADFFRLFWRRGHKACAQCRVGTCTAEDIMLGRFRRWIVDFICD